MPASLADGGSLMGRRQGSRRRGRGRGGKTLLTVGFLLLTLGIIAVRARPATNYELSIYAGTAPLFWVAFAVAMLLSIGISLSSSRGAVKWPALFLGGLAMTAFASLPILRGYVFYGLADAMTHFGWAAEISTGVKSPFQFIYPGAHLSAVLIEATTGGPLPWAMMLVVVIAVMTYFLFIPLAVRAMVPTPTAIVIGTLSGFLLLPLNNIGTHQMFHSYTITTLLVPVMLYLVFKHAGGAADDDSLPTWMSAATPLLVLSGTSMLFFHPQTALDVIIVLGTVVAVQLVVLFRWPTSRLASHRMVHLELVVLCVIFVLWILQFWQTWSMMDGLLQAFYATVEGTADAGKVVDDTGENASSIGVSLVELFIKLFAVAAFYGVVASALVAAKLFHWVDAAPQRDTGIVYFAASGATLTPFFLLHFIGDISGYFFRHVGFAMVLVTVLGAAALVSALEVERSTGRLGKLLRPTLAVILVISLLLTTMAAHPSPYIHKRGHGLSEPMASGFETAFVWDKHADDPVRWASIRSESQRFDDAYVLDDTVRHNDDVPPEMVQRHLVQYYAELRGRYNGDHYLPVTRMSVGQEVSVFRGGDLTMEDFHGIERQYGVHRVQSNEEFALYYIDVSFYDPFDPDNL